MGKRKNNNNKKNNNQIMKSPEHVFLPQTANCQIRSESQCIRIINKNKFKTHFCSRSSRFFRQMYLDAFRQSVGFNFISANRKIFISTNFRYHNQVEQLLCASNVNNCNSISLTHTNRPIGEPLNCCSFID